MSPAEARSGGRAARLLEDFPTAFADFPVGMAVVSPDGRFVRVNPALCRLLDREEVELLGSGIVDLTVPEERQSRADRFQQLVQGEHVASSEIEHWLRPDNTRVTALVHSTSLRDDEGRVRYVLKQLFDRSAEEQARADAERSVRQAEALVGLWDELAGGGLDRERIAQSVLESLLEVIGGGGSVWLTDPVDGVTLEAVAFRSPTPGLEEESRRLFSLVPMRIDEGWPRAAVQSPGGAFVVPHPFQGSPEEPPLLPDYLPLLRRLPLSSLLLVPLLHDDAVLGLLALGRHLPDPMYDEDDVAYARQVARRMSLALANAGAVALERRHARSSEALADLSRACDTALGEPRSVLAAAVDAIARHVPGCCGVVLTGDEAEHLGSLAVAHHHGVADCTLQDALGAPTENEFVRAVLQDRSAHVTDVDIASGKPHELGGGRSAVYGVALEIRGRLAGALVVSNPADRFTVEQRWLVDLLADRLTLVLDNAALLAVTAASQRRHRALVQHSSDMLVLLDRDGTVRYASPAVAATLGEMRDRPLVGVVDPEHLEAAKAIWRAARSRPGVHRPVDLHVVAADGTKRRVSLVFNNLLDDPAVGGIVLTGRDVTAERLGAEQLAEHARLQSAAADVATYALTADRLDTLFDRAARVVRDNLDVASAGVLQLLDDGDYVLRAATHEGLAVGTLRFAAPAGSGLALVASTGQAVVVDDYRTTETVNETAWFERYGILSGALLPIVVDGGVWGVVSAHSAELRRFSQMQVDFLRNVASTLAGALQRSAMEERVRHQATHDAVTGLPNREVLRAALRSALRDAGSVALLLVDLDDFHGVNDSLGRPAGDDVLRQLAHRIAGAVEERGLVARVGEDEFAVCLSGPTGAAVAARLAEELAAEGRRPFTLPAIEITLGVSVGIALGPEHGTDPDRLLQHADLARFRARATQSRRAVFDAGLDAPRSQRMALLTDLRAAIEGGALELHYQPLVDVASGQVHELEALVRWPHPERGVLPPDLFVPLAEQTDLIDDLTLLVARTAAEQAAQWRRDGWSVDVAVNVSPAFLRRGTRVAELVEVLERSEGALGVEIVESALVDEAARAAVRRLCAVGVSCAVDDFGTGYSALAYLRDMPVTRLKVDRAFIPAVDRDERDAALVGGMVRLAHDLSLDVVAEGVETPAVARRLEELGVDVVQGFLYGRPVPASRLDTSRWRTR